MGAVIAIRARVEAAVDRFESETDWELGIGGGEPGYDGCRPRPAEA